MDDLDDMLLRSAPPLAPRSDEMIRDLNHLVASVESVAMRQGRRNLRFVGASAVAVAGVLGLGAAATAAGLVDPPWSQTVSQQASHPGPAVHADELAVGTNCKVVFSADTKVDPLHPVGKGPRAKALAHAKRFVLDFDITTISVAEAVARYKADYAAAALATGPGDLPPSQLVPDGPVSEIEAGAVQSELGRRLEADLAAKGFSTHAVSVVALPECKDESATDRMVPPS